MSLFNEKAGDFHMAQVEKVLLRRIMLVLFLGVLMGALDISIVGPALSAIQTEFVLAPGLVTWAYTAYILLNLIGTLIMSKLSDNYGRRVVYVTCLALFGGGSFVVSVAPSFLVVILGRAIQGFGSGGLFPVASAVIVDTYPPEKRGSALGLIGAVFGISFLVGPIVAGVLLVYSWRYLFVINIPIAVIVGMLALKYLPTRRKENCGVIDRVGIVLISTTLVCLTIGVYSINTEHLVLSLLTFQCLPLLAAALVLFLVFRYYERRRACDPVFNFNIYKSRQAKIIGLIAFGTGLAEGSLGFIPIFAVYAFTVTSSVSSYMLLPIVIVMTFAAPTSGRLLDKKGPRMVIMFGVVFTAIGMTTLALMGASNLPWFYITTVLVGIGLGFSLGAPLRYAIVNEAPVADRAIAQGSLGLFTGLGEMIVGPLAGSIVFSLGSGVAGYGAVYAVIAVLSIALAVICLWFKDFKIEPRTGYQPPQEASAHPLNEAEEATN
jgi:EmrB/QacA subfamily drug resistance transporter